MESWRDEAYLTFLDERNRRIANLRIVAKKGKQNIRVLDELTSREHGEEPVQLLEERTYYYELIEAKAGLRLRETDVVTRGLLRSTGLETGTIEPGSYTGLLPLVLENASGYVVARAALEVLPTKVTYRRDYRWMIEHITERSIDLLLDIRSPTQARFTPDPGRSVETIQERFFFLKSILDSRELWGALQRIEAMPHRHLEPEEHDRDIRRGLKLGGKGLRQLASGTPRTPLPDAHPLAARMRDYGVKRTSLPARVTSIGKRETLNTPENRFVKYALDIFVQFLVRIEKRLHASDSAVDARLLQDVTRLRQRLTTSLSRSFYRDISTLNVLPLGSPILQRKAGYREVLDIWLKFRAASKLVWEGSEDIYGAGKRDMAVLYEYWIFFQLVDLVARRFRLEQPVARTLLERRQNGFGLKLKSGRHIVLNGRSEHTPRALGVRLSYNRTFSHVMTTASSGSWTRSMRPDYTLSLWPAEFTPEQAEYQELMVHIHFDAKYKVDSTEDIFGVEDEDLEAERIEQRNGTYKRSDLLKMHAYHDAIRRSGAAFVLYPGSTTQFWYEFDNEILPSLGAFGVRPARDGSAEGISDVSEFLEQVVAHLCDRATRREQLGYHAYRVLAKPAEYKTTAPIPEINHFTATREVPPAENYVFIGQYVDSTQAEWIRENGVYVWYALNEHEEFRLEADLALVRYLLLHSHINDAESCFWRVKQAGLRVVFGKTLLDMVYPGDIDFNSFYVVYDVEKEPHFEGWEWNTQKLTNLQEGGRSIWPLALILDQALIATSGALPE